MTTNQSTDFRAEIVRGLILAGVLIGVSLLLKHLSPRFLSPDAATRSSGVLMGAVVVVYANSAPKILKPLIETRCDPASDQAIRRFTGWSLVLGGAAYAAAWAIAPWKNADVLASGFLAASVLLVAARVGWGIWRKRHA